MEGLHLAHLGYTHTQTHTQKDMLYGISKHSGTRAHAGTANTSTQSYRPIRSLPTVFHSNIQSHIKASTLSHTHRDSFWISQAYRQTSVFHSSYQYGRNPVEQLKTGACTKAETHISQQQKPCCEYLLSYTRTHALFSLMQLGAFYLTSLSLYYSFTHNPTPTVHMCIGAYGRSERLYYLATVLCHSAQAVPSNPVRHVTAEVSFCVNNNFKMDT